jgi:hypothetical protein
MTPPERHLPDSEDELPSPDALLGATLALMTAWAAPCPAARVDAAAQRQLLAPKVVSNLFFLMHHPAVSETLRRVLAQCHHRWTAVAQAEPGPPARAATVPTGPDADTGEAGWLH